MITSKSDLYRKLIHDEYYSAQLYKISVSMMSTYVDDHFIELQNRSSYNFKLMFESVSQRYKWSLLTSRQNCWMQFDLPVVHRLVCFPSYCGQTSLTTKNRKKMIKWNNAISYIRYSCQSPSANSVLHVCCSRTLQKKKSSSREDYDFDRF